MKTQKEILQQFINLAGGQKTVIEKLQIPQSRLSEWLHEKHQIKLMVFIEMCQKCEVDIKELF